MASTISDSGITFSNTAAAPQLLSVGATVAANALTVTLDPTTLVFRSTTLSVGTPTVSQNATQLSLTIPSGATLGTVNAVQSRIIVLAITVASTMELAVVNQSGGVNLTETGLITTTAISASATSASTIYSTTARTSVPYRVIGYIESTQATAGVWGTSPSTVQSTGGQALNDMSSLGYSQTYQNLTASRVLGTTYYNTTGRPIWVYAWSNSGASGANTFTINGIALNGIYCNATVQIWVSWGIVPPNGSYSITMTNGGPAAWYELR